MNKTCVCIATGPSLTQDDVAYCEGKADVYAVKEAIFYAPFAKLMYCADTDWWEKHEDRWQWFKGEKWTVSSEAHLKYGLNYIKYDNKISFSKDPNLIATGSNSGFQTVNLAYLHGYKRIILLGYDCGYQQGSDKHFYDKTNPRFSRQSNYPDWLERWKKAKPLIDIEIINCTRQTALNIFPKAAISDVL